VRPRGSLANAILSLLPRAQETNTVNGGFMRCELQPMCYDQCTTTEQRERNSAEPISIRDVRVVGTADSAEMTFVRSTALEISRLFDFRSRQMSTPWMSLTSNLSLDTTIPGAVTHWPRRVTDFPMTIILTRQCSDDLAILGHVTQRTRKNKPDHVDRTGRSARDTQQIGAT